MDKTRCIFSLILGSLMVLYWLPLRAELKAAEMESRHYKLQESSLNIGGRRETSPNYSLDESIGELGPGPSNSENYRVKAGYQQMQQSYLSITSPDDVYMSPAISGVTGGVSNGSAQWVVTTDNLAGYTLIIAASSAPALISNVNSFNDYAPSSPGVPDYNWQVSADDSEFGFTPEGSHIVQEFKDDGVSKCNVGSSDTVDTCWYHLSTSAETIATSGFGNFADGVSTKIKFRAESGIDHLQPSGTYTATIVITVIPL